MGKVLCAVCIIYGFLIGKVPHFETVYVYSCLCNCRLLLTLLLSMPFVSVFNGL